MDEFDDYPEMDEFQSDPAASETALRTRLQRLRENPLVWQGQILPAFWTVAAGISMVTNVILIVILLILAEELFTIKTLVDDHLLHGLQQNFRDMDAATIETTVVVDDAITVDDIIPVQFTLSVNQATEVILTENTTIPNTIVTLNGVQIPTNIVLPAGTVLPIALNMNVPVDQTIPIHLNVPVLLEVPVSIPLNQTELHEPFVGLQGVVTPYKSLLEETPDSWCKVGRLTCWLFGEN